MRHFKFIYGLALVATVSIALPACTETLPKQSNLAVEKPGMGRSFSGNYLAGRFAQQQQDWDIAQDYMSAVLTHDADNSLLAQRTFLLSLGSGNFDKARGLAQKLSLSPNETQDLALIFLVSDALNKNDYAAALHHLEALPEDGFGQYTKPLLGAWALFGAGKKEEALQRLATSTTEDDATYRLHAALMAELSGDMNAAAEHYKIAVSSGLNIHSAMMAGNFFERYGQPEINDMINLELAKMYPFNPFIDALSARREKKDLSPNIARPADGAALAMFDLATLLFEKRAYESAQIYGYLVELLEPASPLSSLVLGDVAGINDNLEEAIARYARVEKTAPLYWLSQMRIAQAYESSGSTEKSIDMLTSLAAAKSSRLSAQVALGDIYRRQKKFDKAVDLYTEALSSVEHVAPEHWPIVYARGVSQERLQNWDKAEQDLLLALRFQPNNANILNFIAYSWADKDINLEKALEYIKRAAALQPNDGYILDSYGWTLFKLRRYEEAALWLEQAAELTPDDPTILDHLGDAYWQSGRKTEARYQWQRASSNSEDPLFKKVADLKMQNGISVPRQLSQNDAEAINR